MKPQQGKGIPQPDLAERRGVSEDPSRAGSKARAGRTLRRGRIHFPETKEWPYMVSGQSQTQNQDPIAHLHAPALPTFPGLRVPS